ncbi:MAG: DUF1571 domain-containing protein [Planctomycetes bacterium]|nr:DUF1571 domain-containing protein [Planctomycetota bacterium]
MNGFIRHHLAWSPLSVVLLALGCAKPTVSIPSGVRIEGYEEARKRISANPVGFLEECLAEASKLSAYTLTFQRQERLGILKELKPQENMRAEFREEPFSVRFTWTDDDSEYRQCVYVKGKNSNNVLLLPRNGLMGQPPKVQSYPPNFAVLFGKSRNPITDFGVKRMMERILDRIKKAKPHGEVAIKLCEPTEIGPHKEPCFYLELRYPAGDEFPCKLQDLYISARTKLPVATYLWLSGKVERSGETLDGMYVYSGLRPVEHLADRYFVIDADKKQALAESDESLAGEVGEEEGSTGAPPATDEYFP